LPYVNPDPGEALVFRLRGSPADDLLREVRAEQLNTVFRQMPIALAVNVVNAAITAIVLERLAHLGCLAVWFCAVFLVTAARSVLWLRYRRADIRATADGSWALLAIGGALAAGLCWGVGGALLFPVLPVAGQMFLTVVIGGMCAGSVVMSASHLSTVFAFLLSASLPFAMLFFYQGTVTAGALGAMTLVFTAALSGGARHFNLFFAETVRLRLELSQANRRLQDEIAERQATEAALDQAQKLEAIGRLTGGIAHDFNNLLTIVIGNLTLAMGRIGQNSSTRPLLQSALQAAERGGALIQRLLAFARRQRLDPKPVDLSRLLAGIEELLHRTLGGGIRLAISSEPGLPPARVDANQLELAILNLTINARDAMPEGGSLQIALRRRRAGGGSPPQLSQGEYLVVSIGDTGTGMDDETLARAFEPFFTTKGLGAGSGLGLPMVQGFAAQSGGAVQIRSKLGEGTTVELWLPRAEEPGLDKSAAVGALLAMALGAIC
jgi:signal transduction histidine kinase